MLYDEGKREEVREWFERSARTDAWTQTRVGLLFYYEYEDHEAGKAFLSSAANQGYEPAREVLRSIEQGLNARIVIGVSDCFTTQATSSTREVRICTAKSIESITTVSTRSNAVRTKPRGKELLCINRKEL